MLAKALEKFTVARAGTLARAAAPTRRREIERCLADFGLARGPRRLPAGAVEADGLRRLRAALVCLGPLFTEFGLYLATRADLLPAENCLALSIIPDYAIPMPATTVRKLISAELGLEPETIFQNFTEQACRARLKSQTHEVRLSDGRAALVKIIRPDFERQAVTDLEFLPLLEHALAVIGLSEQQSASAFEDFRHTLLLADLLREAEALTALSEEAREFEPLAAPQVYRQFSTTRVLVMERLPGANLTVLLNEQRNPQALDELAARLCFVWLRQALLGRIFPVATHTAEIMIMPTGQIAFTGGSFARLPDEAKARLLDYLNAASTWNPRRACACLLGEMHRSAQAATEAELQLRFRQIVPFRDGGWSQDGESDSLAEHLFVQWRLASAAGWRPAAHLADFYRGLFLTADTARRLSSSRDPLLNGLGNVQFLAAMQPLRDLFNAAQWGSKASGYAMMMMELPRRLDEALTLAAEGKATIRLRSAEAVTARRQQPAVELLAWLATAAGIWALLQLAPDSPWVESVTCLALWALLFGGFRHR